MVSQKHVMIIEDRRRYLIEVLSGILGELCKRNDPFSQMETIRNDFNINGVCLPKIKPYLTRIAYYTGCSEESLILSIIYIDRLVASNAKFMVTSFNVHGLVLSSILLAVKFYDDLHYKNSHFGKVGGVTCKELNRLEIIFFKEIKYDLYVEKKQYMRYLKSVDKAILEKLASKPKCPVKPTEVTLPVQAFSCQLLTKNRTAVKNAQKPKSIKNISSRKRYEQTDNEAYVTNPIAVVNEKHQVTLFGSQLLYVPVRCFGPGLNNWYNTHAPLIGSA